MSDKVSGNAIRKKGRGFRSKSGKKKSSATPTTPTGEKLSPTLHAIISSNPVDHGSNGTAPAGQDEARTSGKGQSGGSPRRMAGSKPGEDGGGGKSGGSQARTGGEDGGGDTHKSPASGQLGQNRRHGNDGTERQENNGNVEQGVSHKPERAPQGGDSPEAGGVAHREEPSDNVDQEVVLKPRSVVDGHGCHPFPTNAEGSHVQKCGDNDDREESGVDLEGDESPKGRGSEKQEGRDSDDQEETRTFADVLIGDTSSALGADQAGGAEVPEATRAGGDDPNGDRSSVDGGGQGQENGNGGDVGATGTTDDNRGDKNFQPSGTADAEEAATQESKDQSARSEENSEKDIAPDAGGDAPVDVNNNELKAADVEPVGTDEPERQAARDGLLMNGADEGNSVPTEGEPSSVGDAADVGERAPSEGQKDTYKNKLLKGSADETARGPVEEGKGAREKSLKGCDTVSSAQGDGPSADERDVDKDAPIAPVNDEAVKEKGPSDDATPNEIGKDDKNSAAANFSAASKSHPNERADSNGIGDDDEHSQKPSADEVANERRDVSSNTSQRSNGLASNEDSPAGDATDKPTTTAEASDAVEDDVKGEQAASKADADNQAPTATADASEQGNHAAPNEAASNEQMGDNIARKEKSEAGDSPGTTSTPQSSDASGDLGRANDNTDGGTLNDSADEPSVSADTRDAEVEEAASNDDTGVNEADADGSRAPSAAKDQVQAGRHDNDAASSEHTKGGAHALDDGQCAGAADDEHDRQKAGDKFASFAHRHTSKRGWKRALAVVGGISMVAAVSAFVMGVPAGGSASPPPGSRSTLRQGDAPLVAGECLERERGAGWFGQVFGLSSKSQLCVTTDGGYYKGPDGREVALGDVLPEHQTSGGMMCSAERLTRRITGGGALEYTARVGGGRLIFGEGRFCCSHRTTVPSSSAGGRNNAEVRFSDAGDLVVVTADGEVLWSAAEAASGGDEAHEAGDDGADTPVRS